VALTQNKTCGIRHERSGQNLTGISKSDQDFKQGKTCSVLFCFLTGTIYSEHSGRNRTELTNPAPKINH
jgi:hypothetical protein